MLRRHEPRYIGYNPLDSVMMIVSLTLFMMMTCATGWMYTTDRFWGAGWIKVTHRYTSNTLLVMVGIHKLGVLYASRHHRGTVGDAMFTGRNSRPRTGDIR